MTIAYTEYYNYFAGSTSAAWTDINLLANYSIPANSIVEIICANSDTGNERSMGVRTNGSSLDRRLSIHESEGGGATTCRMFVKSDANGIIEYYNEDNTKGLFYIVGYWTGLDWTETWIQAPAFVKGDNGTWKDWTLYATNSVPKGSVCHVIGANSATSATSNLGVRTNGSSLYRYLMTDEAESGGVVTATMFAKTDTTDGIIEIYCTTYGTDAYYLDGYFGNTMDYAELIQTESTTEQDAWTDWDLTSYLDQDGRVCDLNIADNLVGTVITIGFRANGSELNRYILINEAEGSGRENLNLITQTDASGIVEYYGSNTTALQMKLLGYFKFTTATEKSFSDTLGLSDAFSKIVTLLTKTFSDTAGLADAFGIIYKELGFSDSISLANAFTIVFKQLGFADTTTLTDAFSKEQIVETIPKSFADAMSVADAFTLLRMLQFADAAGVSDAFTTPYREMGFADTISMTDVFGIIFKALGFTESFTVSDAFSLLKEMGFADSLSAADSFSIPYKELAFSDALTIADAFGVFLKELGFSDSVILADAFGIIFRTMNFSDSITFSEIFQAVAGVVDKAFSDSISMAEAFAIILKVLPFADSLHVSDTFTIPYREVRFVDTIHVTDLFTILKTMGFSESLTIADAFTKVEIIEKAFSDTAVIVVAFQSRRLDVPIPPKPVVVWTVPSKLLEAILRNER